ncbi:MAG: mannose-1-phosphate guanylyltransferase [Flavobacteriales bacterium]|jgi:mannose-1-phosphate guanylyltransferase
MKNENYYGLIMAGGVGSRFWPKSRTNYPKQFIDILGTGETLLQSTFDRLLEVCLPENIYIVTNTQYTALVLEQLPQLTKEQVISEPARRNTAPCIAYACAKIHKMNAKAITVVSPADHIVTNIKAFATSLNKAMDSAASEDCLITLGVVPSRPDTGYGYIQHNENHLLADKQVKKVKTFTEKPDLELAEQFLDSGDFLWNSGIFVWSTESIMKAFKQHEYDIYSVFETLKVVLNTEQEESKVAVSYLECNNISIDYAVMEKAKNVYVLPVDFGWSDLGTWGSLYEHSKLDQVGNSIQAENITLYNSKNNLINVDSDRLVVVSGLEDFIVVEKDNVLLICPRSEEQNIKQFVTDAKREKGEKFV